MTKSVDDPLVGSVKVAPPPIARLGVADPKLKMLTGGLGTSSTGLPKENSGLGDDDGELKMKGTAGIERALGVLCDKAFSVVSFAALEPKVKENGLGELLMSVASFAGDRVVFVATIASEGTAGLIDISGRTGFSVSAVEVETKGAVIVTSLSPGEESPTDLMEEPSTLVDSKRTDCLRSTGILGDGGSLVSLAFVVFNSLSVAVVSVLELSRVEVNIELAGRGGGVNSVLEAEKNEGMI